MQLSLDERAELAQRPLLSLDEAQESEVERLWVQESERRLTEFRSGQTEAIPADEVFRKANDEIAR